MSEVVSANALMQQRAEKSAVGCTRFASIPHGASFLGDRNTDRDSDFACTIVTWAFKRLDHSDDRAYSFLFALRINQIRYSQAIKRNYDFH